MDAATIILTLGMLSIFAAVFVSLSAVGVFDNQAHGVSKSLAVVKAFSAAPAALQDEVEPSFTDRVLAPLLDRFVGLGKKFTPADYADRVRQKIDTAGNPHGWTVERATSLKVVGTGAMFCLSLLFILVVGTGVGLSLVLVVGATVGGYFGPNMYLYQKSHDRADEMRRTFPDAMDLLTISVEAGLGFDAALAHVAKNLQGVLGQEFARVLQEMQIGMGRATALHALGERTFLPEIKGFVSAMVQADGFGIPIGQVLRVQAAEIRLKRRQRAEEQAQKLPVKLMFPLVLFILPCLFIVVLGPAAINIIAMFAGLNG